MKTPPAIAVSLLFVWLVWLAVPTGATASDRVEELAKASPPAAGGSSSSYHLVSNDVIEMRVYQEEDLLTKLRISRDGTATFPLIGNVTLAGLTVDEAAGRIRTLLGKDFLVNPQVTISVVEYAKRRFTVLGQVQKPGTFEIPSEESVSLLEAIAMAGGYTRLANASRVTVTRVRDGRRTSLSLDARSANNENDGKPFEVQPDDTITIPERVF